MGDTWFTSDTHFGHGRIVETCDRPCVDSAEMDAEIIRRWNLAVAPEDIVWVLGDWALGDKVRGLEIVSELHGTKHLVAGNYDACRPGKIGAEKHLKAFLDAGFASVGARCCQATSLTKGIPTAMTATRNFACAPRGNGCCTGTSMVPSWPRVGVSMSESTSAASRRCLHWCLPS